MIKNIPKRIYLDISGFENSELSFDSVRSKYGIPYYVRSLPDRTSIRFIQEDTFIERTYNVLMNNLGDRFVSKKGFKKAFVKAMRNEIDTCDE